MTSPTPAMIATSATTKRTRICPRLRDRSVDLGTAGSLHRPRPEQTDQRRGRGIGRRDDDLYGVLAEVTWVRRDGCAVLVDARERRVLEARDQPLLCREDGGRFGTPAWLAREGAG